MKNMLLARGLPLGVSLVALLATVVTPSSAEATWQVVAPVPTVETLHDVAWGAGLYVAVGANGTILESPDPVSWEVVPSPTAADLDGTVWTGSSFVAVGETGTILISPDGLSWNTRTSPTQADLRAVAVGPSGLIAVGEAGTVISSANGEAWTLQPVSAPWALNGVAWTGTTWVAVGEDGSVALSEDGSTWSLSRVPDLESDLYDVCTHAGQLVIVGERAALVGTVDDIFSSDWGWGRFRAVASCGEVLAAVSARGGHGLFDPDRGRFMATASRHQEMSLNGLTCGPDGLVAVGEHGHVGTSLDGTRWRHMTAPTSFTIGDVAVGPAATVAVGTGSWQESSVILTSADGLGWAMVEQPIWQTVHSVAQGGGRFVAVGDTIYETPWDGGWVIGWVWTSTDGRSWAIQQLPDRYSRAVTWDGERFILVGRNLGLSADGEQWTWMAHPAGSTDVASSGDMTVTVGWQSLWSSPDLTSWSEFGLDLAGLGELERIAWGGGSFVAVGTDGVIVTSGNGIDWVRPDSGTTSDLHAVAWTGEVFVVAGDDGLVLSSGDGEHWQPSPTGVDLDLHAVAAVNGTWLAAGELGVILRRVDSPPGGPPEAAFTWLPAPAVTAMPVRFVDLSRPEPTTWTWQLGDGATATSQNVSHHYPSAGIYQVELEVANSEGSSTASAAIEVTTVCEPPPAPVVSAPAEVASLELYGVSWTGAASYEFVLEESRDPSFTHVSDFVTLRSSQLFAHSWHSGPQRFYRVRAVRLCPDGELAGEWSAPVMVRIKPSLDDLPRYQSFLPVAAHSDGLEGTRWRTELVIQNPDRWPVTGLLYLLDGGAPCSELYAFDLAAGAALRVTDLAAMLCGEGTAVGGVGLASTRELLATSRTFNETPSGDFGQRIPVVGPEDAVDPGETRRLLQLERSPGYRTNLGLSNVGEAEAAVDIEVRAADGSRLGGTTVNVESWDHVQLTDVFDRLQIGDTADAWATVTALGDPDQSLYAYASVIDNRSGDATAQVAMPPPAQCSASVSCALPNFSDQPWYCAGGSGKVHVIAGRGHIATFAEDGRGWVVDDLVHYWHELRDVGFNGSGFVAVGNVSMVSQDGRSWQRYAWFDDMLRGLTWTGSEWIAVGDNGIVARSPDGGEWQVQHIPTEGLRAVVWTGNGFVAAAIDGTVALSPDGSQWQVHDTGLGRITDLAWGAGTLVAVELDRIYWSDDGISWTEAVAIGEQVGPTLLEWTGDRFLAVSGTTVHASLDGRRWQVMTCTEGSLSCGGVRRTPSAIDVAWDGRELIGAGGFNRSPVFFVPHDPSLLVPAAANLDGQDGSRWRTDVELLNHGQDAVSCRLELLPHGQGAGLPQTAAVEVPAGQARRLENVLATVFGHDGKAAIRIVPDQPTLAVGARTYDDRDDGTLGQWVGALSGADELRYFHQGRLIGLNHSADPAVGARSNLGLVSSCSEPMTVEITLYRGSGETVGSLDIELEPHRLRHLNNVLAPFADGDVDSGYATLATSSTSCAFHAWASVIDNRSGDPIFIPAMKTP